MSKQLKVTLKRIKRLPEDDRLTALIERFGKEYSISELERLAKKC